MSIFVLTNLIQEAILNYSLQIVYHGTHVTYNTMEKQENLSYNL